MAPFKLVARPGYCGPSISIACADMTTQTIFISNDNEPVDRTTIMMHEIGHLLGVPHIEGDALMDAKYQYKALDGPTDKAVAIAKTVYASSVPRCIYSPCRVEDNVIWIPDSSGTSQIKFTTRKWNFKP